MVVYEYFIGLVIIFIILLIFAETISYYLLNRLSLAPSKEFPKIKKDDIEKFTSFDPKLGWEPTPNSVKKQRVRTGSGGTKNITRSIDRYGSRVCEIGRDESEVSVTTFGDSYCFCREVNDDETFQHHLASDLNIHVSNYGVGNYGLDQSLLRLKRRFPDDQADYVVMCVTSTTIARILSVWKHYHEFGNTFAVKPRYRLTDTGDLEFIESPVESRSDLLALDQYKEYFRKYDYHYEHWFRLRQRRMPYTLRFLRRRDNPRFALFSTLRFLENNYNVSIPGVDAQEQWLISKRRKKDELVRYHELLFQQFDELYCELLGDFVRFVTDHDSVPIFLPLQQLRYVAVESEYGMIDEHIVSLLEDRYPEMVICDPREELQQQVGDVSELYVRRGEGGHHSPTANKLIAGKLSNTISRLEDDRAPNSGR